MSLWVVKARIGRSDPSFVVVDAADEAGACHAAIPALEEYARTRGLHPFTDVHARPYELGALVDPWLPPFTPIHP